MRQDNTIYKLSIKLIFSRQSKKKKKKKKKEITYFNCNANLCSMQNKQTENSGSMMNHAQTKCLFHASLLKQIIACRTIIIIIIIIIIMKISADVIINFVGQRKYEF